MKPRFGSALMGLAVFILGTASLRAEDPGLSCSLKLRGLVSSTSSDQGMSNGVLGNNLAMGAGFGLELGYALGPGRITGELGYTVQSGDAFLGNTGDMRTYGSGVVIDSANSVDSRKNKVEGLHLRLGYEAPWTGSLSWRAGLQFGGNKFTHQVLGNVNGTSAAGSFSDSYFYVGSKTASTPSPFAGLTYKFDEASSFEFGVLFLSYTSLSYQHVANTQNQFDSVTTSDRIVPNLEIAYVFRF
ncbi:hypothetical protein GETHLI_01860 [Geothrix limicola]|uniref:Outer membrane protein beta-barrel domain-containing protein n=1 Tax=Geothrix limicola TaxID=2927978 RepID=A0ABQ5QC98_9BACT|nr:hypothetical protein [Geothrix limicola]GLH71684.1 hypothetical protein GETHLI_01860 [Geothrix limicola]